jgi:hypothetical protein
MLKKWKEYGWKHKAYSKPSHPQIVPHKSQVTKQTCHPWHNSYTNYVQADDDFSNSAQMSRYFTCSLSYASYTNTWNRHGATHLSLGSEQERTQFLGPNFLVILLHVELITIGMKSRWGLRDPKEGCTPLTSTQKKPWNESQNRKENGKDLRYCVTQYFHLTLPCHGKIVNQQPPVHHEGWWMASVVTHQFSAGFHFPS